MAAAGPNCWTMKVFVSTSQFVLRTVIWLPLVQKLKHCFLGKEVQKSKPRSMKGLGDGSLLGRRNIRSSWSDLLTTDAPVPPSIGNHTVPGIVDGSASNIFVEDIPAASGRLAWWSAGEEVRAVRKGKGISSFWKLNGEKQSGLLENPPASQVEIKKKKRKRASLQTIWLSSQGITKYLPLKEDWNLNGQVGT